MLKVFLKIGLTMQLKDAAKGYLQPGFAKNRILPKTKFVIEEILSASSL